MYIQNDTNLPIIVNPQQSLNLTLTAQPTASDETVKSRFLELMELTLMGLSQEEDGGMVAALGPLLLMGLQEKSAQTLKRLLICLHGIVQAVLDSGSLPVEYNTRMEPLIRDLVAVVQEF